ncbi:CD1247 N-terminal domain-containing protein [Thermovirga sp.]|uniref:CD1247 N-terminal domain-containing protein n=1 Tax=Thermovirga sp. TaxID=2699834 RepID=UPI0025F16F84|nr:CD1247 N-terminal domain-containing protein [Thermovirga sp.]MBO8153558.1 hypothetical protein [Thermovirga sp.]MCD6183178.1 hypothetical protein [Thermovirga sp.]
MKSKERIAYLQGLLDGLKVEGEETKKIYEAIVEALKALSYEIEEHEEVLMEQQEFLGELADYCEQLEEDITNLEETAQGEWEDEDYEDEEELDYPSVTCPECGYLFFYDPEEYEEGEQLQCPECGFLMDIPEE